MNKGKVYANLKKLQKSLDYNMKVFSVNQTWRKRSKTLRNISRIWMNIFKAQLNYFIFSQVDTEKEIDKLSNNSFGGPDGFLAILLKIYKLSLSKPI